MQAEGGKEGEDGAVLEVDVAAEDIGVLVEDAGAGVVGGERKQNLELLQSFTLVQILC